MSGCNVSASSCGRDLQLADPLAESDFKFLPDEMILDIFTKVQRECFPQLRLVCSEFKRIVDDRVLMKKEIEAIQDTVRRLGETLGTQVQAREAAASNLEAEEPFLLRMFRLRALVTEGLSRLTKRQLALSLPDPLLMREAPLFSRFFKKEYIKAWHRHFNEEMRLRGNSLLLDYSVHPENLLYFAEALRTLPQIPCVELDCAMGEVDAIFIAEAFAAGLFTIPEVSIRGNQQFDRRIFSTLLNGISRCPHVKKLSLLNCSLFGQVFDRIREALEGNSTIESLALNDFAFTEQSLETVAGMLELHPEIRSLFLSGCSNQEVRELLQRINRTHLMELGICHSDIREDTIEYLAEHLSDLKNVSEFDLEQNKFSNEEIELLSQAAKRAQHPIKLKLPEKKIDLSLLRQLRLLV